MIIKKLFSDIRDLIIEKQVRNMNIPVFDPSDTFRVKAVFYGHVQRVGFRYEAALLAECLYITGYAENMPDGSVICELQGEKNKIDYLLEEMQKIPRIKVSKLETVYIPIIPDEREFDTR